MKPRRALVVEDDDRIVPSIEDALFSLGHKVDHVTNQADAQAKLQAGGYDYVLLDLQIPARPHRGGASTEYGVNLLRAIRHTHGPARLPVIIMTAHGGACVDLTKELTRNGANEFIAKPFPEKGRTLVAVIRDVLEEQERRNGATPRSDCESRPVEKLTVAFGLDRIEVLGETIAERTERGNFWAVLQRLKRRRDDGRYVPARARELAELFKGRSATENTVSSCVSDLRERIRAALARQGYRCGRDDVIVSGGPGYRFGPKITVEELDGNASASCGDIGAGTCRDIAGTCGDTNLSDVPAPRPDVPAGPANVPLNERQHWALDQLRGGAKLGRGQVEKQFRIVPKTAKRDLSDLVKRGLVEYVRTPRPGFYRLKKR